MCARCCLFGCMEGILGGGDLVHTMLSFCIMSGKGGNEGGGGKWNMYCYRGAICLLE